MKSKVCVVVSYWAGRPPKNLHSLLRQMMRIDSGVPFDTIVVCNGGDSEALTIPTKYAPLNIKIINRENSGYNIGAWDAGWRATAGYDYYMFMQDECFIKCSGWLSEFVFRMVEDVQIGLLGEAIMWDKMSWKYIRTATDRDLGTAWYDTGGPHPIDIYREFMMSLGVEPGVCGTHLQSLLLFASGEIMKEVGGFLIGETYHQAVASEIGFSRLVESKGYRISKVKDAPYALIGHRQWTSAHVMKTKIRTALRNFLKGVRK